MSRPIALCGAAALIVVSSLVATPAHAEGEFPITVTPTSGKPSETFNVTGDATDPVCADDGVAVTLHFTRSDGSTGTLVENTTTDAAGHFTAELAVPDNAYAGEKAFVSAVIADCTPPESTEPPFARSSVSVDFDVLAYAGEFAISAKQGGPGDVLEFAGTDCWGGAVTFFFGDEVLSGQPESDKTFAGEFELPDLPDGVYEVGAECPGTDYKVLSFRLVNPAAPAAPPAAPPARPVTRPPTFTG